MKTTKTILNIYGMHCTACSRLIENALSNSLGVQKATVNFATEKATVIFDEEKTNIDSLLKSVEKTGYKAEVENKNDFDEQKKRKKKEINSLKKSLIASLLLSLPLVFFMLLDFIPKSVFSEQIMPYFGLISFLLATPIQFIVGKRYYQSAWASLRLKTFNMDSLISIGTLTAYLYSLFNFLNYFLQNKTFIPPIGEKIPDLFFETSAFLITFVTLGKYLESISKAKTNLALEKLIDLSPKTANLLKNGKIISIPLSEIKIGNILLIKPGEKIPLDGEIISGNSSIDESLLTGESLPVDKKTGDKIYAGTLNKMGSLEIKTTKLGSETALARIIQFVEDAQSSKAPIQDLADNISSYFVPAIISIALITFIIWYFILGQTLNYSLLTFISVIVIACPCALGLATPTALLVGTGLAAQNGILIKGGEPLEKATKINTIVFDKTGTLTRGQPEVTDVIPIKTSVILSKAKDPNLCKETRNTPVLRNEGQLVTRQLLQLCASLEKHSEHPLAQAVVNYAQKEKMDFLEVSDFQSLPGSGVTGTINGIKYFLGSPRHSGLVYPERHRSDPESTPPRHSGLDPESIKIINSLQSQGKTVMVLSREYSSNILRAIHQPAESREVHNNNFEVLGFLALADTLKDSAKPTIKNLQSQGYEIYMITGDNKNTAQNIAGQLSITNVLAQVLPEQKALEIQKLQQQRKKVAFVGDGINDAPALVQADLGIALGRGTDIAIESGEIVILKDDLGKIPQALEISKKTYNKIKTNLFFALIYNILGIPIAARVFAFAGLVLKPELAGLAMALSSVSVVSNSLLLNLYKPKSNK